MSQQLLSFYCRMWRDTSISSSTFLISLTNCCHHFLAPGVLMIGGEVCSTPKEATRASRRCLRATTSPSCPARRGWKCCFDASKIIGCTASNIMVFVCGPLWYGSCISAPIFLANFNKSARLWVKKNKKNIDLFFTRTSPAYVLGELRGPRFFQETF